MVDDEIEHDDDPAYVPEHEAAKVVNQQWAGHVEHLMVRGNMESGQHLGATTHTKKCVLLEFSRHPQELEYALLTSSVADAARSQGIEIQPEWARGAKIFVKGFGPDQLDEPLANGQLKPWHVIVYESDEADLHAALQCLPVRVKKLKPGIGRSIVPQELSLMSVSSEGNHDVTNDAWPVIEYVIKNTFLELVESHPVVRSAQSV